MPRINAATDANAPEASKPLLDAVIKKMGKAPQLFRTFAQAPVVFESYLNTGETLGKGALGAKERELIALAVAQANGCDYCLAAHTTIGGMVGLDADTMLNARRGSVSDPKWSALLDFTRSVVSERGAVPDAGLAAFRDAGWTDQHALEVVANVAHNVLTNYTNTLAQTEVDFPAAPELTASVG